MILKLNLTAVSLLVRAVRSKSNQSHDNQSQEAACKARIETWSVIGGILKSKDETSCNTANAAHTDKRRRAESTLPLSTDVVGLPSENGRDVGVAASGGKEDTKVASTN